VKRFRGGLVFKAQRLVYHLTLGLRVIKKKTYGLPTLRHVFEERIFIELMTTDRKLKASREGSK